MDKVIHNFLTTGNLASLELGMSVGNVLRLLPSVKFAREMVEGLKVYDRGDILVVADDDVVFQFTLYFWDRNLVFPPELNLNESAVPRTKRHFLKYLNENDLVQSPYLNLSGIEIGLKLKSGVFVTFDRQKLYSIGKSRLHE